MGWASQGPEGAAQLNNKLKDLTKRVFEAFEFDIKRYDRCSVLDAIGWISVLHVRYVLCQYLDFGKTDGSEEERARCRRWLIALIESPLPSREAKPLWSRMKYQSVYDLDVYGAWQMPDAFEEIPDAAKACEERHRNLGNPDYQQSPLVSSSLHSLFLERNVQDRPSYRSVIAVVRLGDTDEKIKAEFARWLAVKQEELRTHNVPQPEWSKFTEADFRRWHQHRVLAFIDLQMIAELMGLQPTDEMIGDYLFPGLDGVAERARKTVRPLARDLMKPETLDALDGQASAAYYQAEEKVR